jgi:hypothetical protein
MPAGYRLTKHLAEAVNHLVCPWTRWRAFGAIGFAFGGISQNCIGHIDTGHHLDSAGRLVHIRVIAPGQLSIGSLYLSVGCVGRYAKYGIEIVIHV